MGRGEALRSSKSWALKRIARVNGIVVVIPMAMVRYMALGTVRDGRAHSSAMWVALSVQRKPY